MGDPLEAKDSPVSVEFERINSSLLLFCANNCYNNCKNDSNLWVDSPGLV